jgi:hypothetical protein
VATSVKTLRIYADNWYNVLEENPAYKKNVNLLQKRFIELVT